MLLHGQGGWAGVWLPVMGNLGRDHRVVAPDLPGLGASRVDGAPPDAGHSLGVDQPEASLQTLRRPLDQG